MNTGRQRASVKWYYEGILVSKRWLEFNYGKQIVAQYVSQLMSFSISNPGKLCQLSPSLCAVYTIITLT